jgi:hypothetical protein
MKKVERLHRRGASASSFIQTQDMGAGSGLDRSTMQGPHLSRAGGSSRMGGSEARDESACGRLSRISPKTPEHLPWRAKNGTMVIELPDIDDLGAWGALPGSREHS